MPPTGLPNCNNISDAAEIVTLWGTYPVITVRVKLTSSVIELKTNGTHVDMTSDLDISRGLHEL